MNKYVVSTCVYIDLCMLLLYYKIPFSTRNKLISGYTLKDIISPLFCLGMEYGDEAVIISWLEKLNHSHS